VGVPDQAIVIIHGMGDQRPMDFLRGFVGAAVPPGQQFFSQPDPLSESLELRRFRVLTSDTRPPTYLYEYYWAHHMQGSELRHLWPLVKRVFLSWPWRVGGSLQFVYWSVWILTLYLALRFVAFLGTQAVASSKSVSDFVTDFGFGPLGTTVAVLLLGAVQSFLVHYFGDVARYLDPKPHNIAIRQAIRSEALGLLEKVSDRHDRVIVVAHSLGSIVALDVLGHLWSKLLLPALRDTRRPARARPGREAWSSARLGPKPA
jgi:hypothetical protein